MNAMFEVNHVVPVVFGPGVSKQAGEKLKGFGCKKVFLCYDRGIEKAGLVEGVLKSITEAGLEVVCYGDAQLEPDCAAVDKAGEIARREQVDGVVGLGGGSSMDVAKGVGVLLSNPGKTYDWIFYKPNTRKYPLLLIPTTAGTSTEVAPFNAVTDETTGKKSGSPYAASLALVDPELLLKCPPFITAIAGCDILAHTIESYTNPNVENWMVDNLDEVSIELAFKYLPIAVKDGGNLEARAKVSFACFNAGYAFGTSKGTHLGHAIADTMQIHYKELPHGLVAAFSTPVVLRYFAAICPGQVRNVGKMLGIVLPEKFSDQLVGDYIASAYRDFLRDIGVKNLQEYNVTKEGLEKVIPLVKDNFRFAKFKTQPDFERISNLIREEFNA